MPNPLLFTPRLPTGGDGPVQCLPPLASGLGTHVYAVACIVPDLFALSYAEFEAKYPGMTRDYQDAACDYLEDCATAARRNIAALTNRNS